MPIDLSPLDNHYDLLFEVPLKVRQGHRFQPTGFPDLGAAEFDTPKAGRCSSSPRRAWRIGWKLCAGTRARTISSSRYGVSATSLSRTTSGAFLTSSVLEAHRLNSPYIEKATPNCHAEIQNEIGVKNRPIDRPRFVKTVLKYDVGSLLHGVFLESMDGRLRIARSISAFIEADGVKTAASGGVKNDRVHAAKDEAGGRTAKEGFGNLPFPRDEYTAEKITLYTSVDLAQIRGYGLGEDATKLLIMLAFFKLRSFVDSPMRLRTACSFDLVDAGDIIGKNIPAFKLPKRDALVGKKGENNEWTGELPALVRKLTGAQLAEADETKTEKMRPTTVTFTI